MKSSPTLWQLLSSRVLTVEQHREVDRQAVAKYHMNSLVLMENAASESARWLANRIPRASSVVLCGRGNNGGDGFAIARHLRVLGWTCRVVMLGPPDQLAPDARTNFEILESAAARSLVGCVPTRDASSVGNELLISTAETAAVDQPQLDDWLQSADVIVDAMLGTGATGAPRKPMKEWIEMANRSRAFRVAIDLPTGLDATTGLASSPTFAANATLTFVAKKPAMNKQCVELGEIVVLPIGIPEEHIRELLELESDADRIA